jgi:hypothetical protein
MNITDYIKHLKLPATYTMGETLNFIRASLSLVLMLLIFLLDATLDRVDLTDDAYKILNKCLEKQESIIKQLTTFKSELKRFKDAATRDEMIKYEILKTYDELRLLAKDDLHECVGEVMNDAELAVANVSIFERIIKTVMSVMMVV